MSCRQFAENSIPVVFFTLTMKFEFRELLQKHNLLKFDELSGFSEKFIGTLVTQQNIDRAVSQAFEKFGLAFRADAQRNRTIFELKNIEKYTSQEAKIKELLVRVVRKNQHGL
jgi:hypothetical protein